MCDVPRNEDPSPKKYWWPEDWPPPTEVLAHMTQEEVFRIAKTRLRTHFLVTVVAPILLLVAGFGVVGVNLKEIIDARVQTTLSDAMNKELESIQRQREELLKQQGGFEVQLNSVVQRLVNAEKTVTDARDKASNLLAVVEAEAKEIEDRTIDIRSVLSLSETETSDIQEKIELIKGFDEYPTGLGEFFAAKALDVQSVNNWRQLAREFSLRGTEARNRHATYLIGPLRQNAIFRVNVVGTHNSQWERGGWATIVVRTSKFRGPRTDEAWISKNSSSEMIVGVTTVAAKQDDGTVIQMLALEIERGHQAIHNGIIFLEGMLQDVVSEEVSGRNVPFELIVPN